MTYERVVEYARRKNTDLAHFNGGLVLSKPGTREDGLQLGVLDGRLASYSVSADESVIADIKVLRNGRLREMIDSSENDWRIYNVDNHFIDPSGPFTGRITLDGGGGVVYEHHVELKVKNDRVENAQRRWFFGLVD